MSAIASSIAFRRFAERACSDPNLELEVAIDAAISRPMFCRLVHTLECDTGTSPDEVLQLDVIHDSTRSEFVGADLIEKLLGVTNRSLGGTVVPSRVLMKRREMAPVRHEEHEYVVRLKREVDVAVDAQAHARIDLDAFRLKRRYSFTVGNCRIDCTAVQEKRKGAERSVQRAVHFEVEVEFVNTPERTPDPDSVVQELHVAAMRCMGVMLGSSHPVPRSDQKVIAQFLNCAQESKLKVQTPQPVTLDVSHVREALWSGYTVTDKADGMRCQVVIVSGRAYTLDAMSALRLVATGLPKRLDATILDGELITRDVHDAPINTFAAFDVYRMGGVSTSALPLVNKRGGDSRVERVAQCVRGFYEAATLDDFQILAKRFVEVDGNGDAIRDTLTRMRAGTYATDGLIFTPRDLAVGARFAGDLPLVEGVWPGLLKWKPPDCNTIDFVVRPCAAFEVDGALVSVPLPDEMGTGRCKVFQVHASYVPRKWEGLDVSKFVQFGEKAFPAADACPKRFDIPGAPEEARIFVPVDAGDTAVCRDGSVVLSDCVVECAYSPGAPGQGHWVAMRVRPDKTERMERLGVAGSANDWGTALSVWSSIVHPVTEAMLVRDQECPPPTASTSEAYYVNRAFTRKRSMLKNMANFHANVVKGWLYGEAERLTSAANRPALFEMACGKGGDLPRWAAGTFDPIIGIDKSIDNIVNCIDGVYARMVSSHPQLGQRTCAFVCMDASTRMRPPLDEIRIAAADSDHGDVIAALWDTSSRPMTNTTLTPYRGVVPKGFDVVSCQFAIHYMFENDMVLDRFVRNLDFLLRPGGVFIATCFDGDKLARDLERVRGGRIVGQARAGACAWSIEKKYEGTFGGGTGAGIDVFVETINQTVREYLVSPALLRARLKGIGVEQVGAAPFASFSESTSGAMDATERELSHKNVAYVFKRTVAVTGGDEGDRVPEPPTVSRGTAGARRDQACLAGDLE